MANSFTVASHGAYSVSIAG